MTDMTASSAADLAGQLRDPDLLRQACFVGGQWLDAERRIAVRNPATNDVIAEVPSLDAAAVRAAIDAAHAALPSWRSATVGVRAAALERWFDLIVEHRQDLALILTMEQGKPIAESLGEISYAASFVRWFSEEARRIYGDVIPGQEPGRHNLVIKQPVGVCAAITPWNFPAAMITRKVAAALAAGCTIVVKPASQTPLIAFALCRLAERAGVPAGVVSCVTGPAREIGAELTSNPLVRKLSFTGSTDVGRTLLAQCAPTIKRTSMELGGNAPFIVFDDADIDAAVEGAMAAKYRNAGQACVAANRILVQDAVYDAFVEKLAAATSALQVGPGYQPGVEVGPLIDAAACSFLEEIVADAREKGATILAGEQVVSNELARGAFFRPLVITEATTQMRAFTEEVFGPVAPVFRFSTEQEAIELANSTEYGLAAYFFGRDIGRVFRVAEALEFGMVGVNTGAISTELAPFGGIKQSGHGREGSKYGVDDYLDIKYISIRS